MLVWHKEQETRRMPVKNRILALMGEKQARDNEPVNGAIVARKVGLTRQAISKWIKGDISHFSSETIIALCKYFECEIGDLLYIEKPEKPEQDEEQSQSERHK